jgi:hypothetical protein
MRTRTVSVLAALPVVVVLAASAAVAEDPKKIDLVYRWDQLDGKTAVYDTEIVSRTLNESHMATAGADEGSEPEAENQKIEIDTTTKQRLSLTFKAENERGLVTITTGRAQVEMTIKAANTETYAYDSENPPKEIPEQLKGLVKTLERKPYTLTVSPRGVVEKIEGLPGAKPADMKGTFLVLPDHPLGEGESWTDVKRDPAGAYGDVVQRMTFKLAKVTEKDERKIDAEIATQLDQSKADPPKGVIARIEKPRGKGHVTLDASGLKVEEEIESGYEFYVKQVSDLRQIEGTEKKITTLATFRWKLVEVKNAK